MIGVVLSREKKKKKKDPQILSEIRPYRDQFNWKDKFSHSIKRLAKVWNKQQNNCS